MIGGFFVGFMGKVRDFYQTKTCQTLFLYGFMGEPLFVLYGFIPCILRKDLSATSLQIAILTSLKPVVSIFSFYWSSSVKGKKEGLKNNLLYAALLSRVPFLLFPFVASSWFLVASSAFYMLFSRASIPAWMEVLRRNLPEEKRGKAFSWSYALTYLEGMGLCWAVGALLDQNEGLWRSLFFVTALIGMAGVYLIKRLPIKPSSTPFAGNPDFSIKKSFTKPWKDTFHLMRTRPDFALFQWGFMLCGFGIMLAQPILPLTLIDHLAFNYTQYGLATIACKGLFIVISSPFWGRFLHKVSPFKISFFVFSLTALFLVFLALSYSFSFLAYVAFCFYGIAQGGSHLLWSLSGTYFSKEADSSLFSGVNVVMVGLRGMVAPLLGAFFSLFFPSFSILLLGAFLCFSACFLVLKKRENRIFSPHF